MLLILPGRLSLGLQLVCGWPMLVFVFNAVPIMRRIFFFFFKLYIYKKKQQQIIYCIYKNLKMVETCMNVPSSIPLYLFLR